MKKLYLFLLLVVATISAHAWSVKFTNPSSWAQPYVYVYGTNASGDANKWPGVKMTKSGELWEYSQDGAAPANIIFNNGSGGGTNQTGDLVFGASNDGKTFDNNGPVGAQLNTYSVYWDNTGTGWTNVYAYTWDGINYDGSGSWPGKKLSLKAGSSTIYEFSVNVVSDPTGAKLIFNNGSGGTVGVDQTENLVFTTGETYSLKPADPNDKTSWYVNLYGDFNEWADNGIQSQDGIYNFSAELGVGKGEFEIKIWDNKDDLFYGVSGGTVTLGQTTNLVQDAGHITIAGGAKEGVTYNVTVNLNGDNYTILVTSDEPIVDPEPEIPENLYLIGTILDHEWGDNVYPQLMDNEGDGFFSLTATINTAYENEYGYFALTTVNSEDWSVVNAKRYGPSVTNTLITVGDSEEEVDIDGTGDVAWMIAPGTYTFNVSWEDMILTIEKVEEPVKPVEIVSFTPISPSGKVATSEVDVKCSYVVENAADDATYTIYYGTDDNNLNQSVVGTATEATIHFTGLQPSKSYDYGVKLVVVSGTQTVESTIKSIIFNTTDFDSGIESITVEANGAVRYYNLQGVEVANPAAGLYIEVRNGNVSKVNVK